MLKLGAEADTIRGSLDDTLNCLAWSLLGTCLDLIIDRVRSFRVS